MEAQQNWKHSFDSVTEAVYRAFGKSLGEVIAESLAASEKRNNQNQGANIEEKPKTSGSVVINSKRDVLVAQMRAKRENDAARKESKKVRIQEKQVHILDSVETYVIDLNSPPTEGLWGRSIATPEQEAEMLAKCRISRFENFRLRNPQKIMKMEKEKASFAALAEKFGQVALDGNKDEKGSVME